MAYSNTTLLGLNQPTTGQESGVWGDDVNNGFTQLVDISVAGTNNITYDGDVTLSVGNGNNASSYTSTTTTSTSTAIAQYYILNLSGSRAAARSIIAPASSRSFLITNATTVTYTIKKTSGTGVTVAAGETALVYYNTVTADYAKASSNLVTGLTGVLPTANGGTNLTSFTANGVVYASSTSALATGSALTFDGANLGIGTSSPSRILTIEKSGAAFPSTSNPTVRLNETSSGRFAVMELDSSTNLNIWNGDAGSGSIRFYRGSGSGTESMRIDSSGNVGIGVTPSAWSGNTALQIGNYGAFSGGSTFGAVMSSNAYSTSAGWAAKYIASTYATLYTQQQTSGTHAWYNAPSGTAGTSISFTQAMTLSAAGGLSVGTTADPGAGNLAVGSTTIGGSNLSVYKASGDTRIYVGNSSSTTAQIGCESGGNTVYIGSTTSTPVIFRINDTEKARIDTSGNLGLGVTPSAGSGRPNFNVGGAGTGLVGTTGNIDLVSSAYYAGGWKNGDASYQPTRIDISNGVFSWNTASVASVGTAITWTTPMTLSNAGGLSVGTTADPGAGAIYATGNITAYYSSDIKFKENVQDIPDALGIVTAIGSKTFDWTDEYLAERGGEDEYFQPKQSFGVIAQDVQKVFPQAVRTREDGSLAVDYEKLAILSFGAIGQLLKRVEALEAK